MLIGLVVSLSLDPASGSATDDALADLVIDEDDDAERQRSKPPLPPATSRDRV